ncbi:MAG: HAD family hydrolase [Nanoarchaeota archaeon]
MIRYLILDLDGTLYKKRSVVEYYLKQFAKAKNLNFTKIHKKFTRAYVVAKEKTYKNTNIFWSQVHELFLHSINSDQKEFLDALAEEAKLNLVHSIRPRKYLIDLLKRAKDSGIAIVIFTGSNNMYDVIKLSESEAEYNALLALKKKQIEVLGLSEYVDKLILANKYGGFKPQKFVFEKLLQDLNACADECIMIGDTYNDIGATQVGIFSILIGNNDTKEFRPNLIARTFKEITNIIDFERCILKRSD